MLADPDKLKAITEFPHPKHITDLRSFMELVKQLNGFLKEVRGAKEPLRPLLRTATPPRTRAIKRHSRIPRDADQPTCPHLFRPFVGNYATDRRIY